MHQAYSRARLKLVALAPMLHWNVISALGKGLTYVICMYAHRVQTLVAVTSRLWKLVLLEACGWSYCCLAVLEALGETKKEMDDRAHILAPSLLLLSALVIAGTHDIEVPWALEVL